MSEEDYDLMDSLAKVDNYKMTIDSAKRIAHVAEGAEGKHVLGYALAKYQSKWLDSLAKARRNFFIKTLSAD